MSYKRVYRLDLIDSHTGAALGESYPETKRADAQREARDRSLDLTGGRNLDRVRVVAMPIMVRPAEVTTWLN